MDQGFLSFMVLDEGLLVRDHPIICTDLLKYQQCPTHPSLSKNIHDKLEIKTGNFQETMPITKGLWTHLVRLYEDKCIDQSGGSSILHINEQA